MSEKCLGGNGVRSGTTVATKTRKQMAKKIFKQEWNRTDWGKEEEEDKLMMKKY